MRLAGPISLRQSITCWIVDTGDKTSSGNKSKLGMNFWPMSLRKCARMESERFFNSCLDNWLFAADPIVSSIILYSCMLQCSRRRFIVSIRLSSISTNNRRKCCSGVRITGALPSSIHFGGRLMRGTTGSWSVSTLDSLMHDSQRSCHWSSWYLSSLVGVFSADVDAAVTVIVLPCKVLLSNSVCSKTTAAVFSEKKKLNECMITFKPLALVPASELSLSAISRSVSWTVR